MANRFFLDQFIRDKHNRIVIYQNPNIPLSSWIILSVLNMALGSGNFKNGVEFASSALLVTWAYLEIISGASYFRRFLGGVVLLMTLLTHFR